MSIEKADAVLILEPPGAQDISAAMQRVLPGATLILANDAAAYDKALAANEYSLIVIDHAAAGDAAARLLQGLRFREVEPSVLMIGDCDSGSVLMALQRAGCHRYLSRAGAANGELGPAVRGLLRMRKLVEENRRLNAKLLEANQYLEEKNKRLDDFSSTVAHDIRGSIAGLCMKLDYALDAYGGGMEPRAREILQSALRGGERLTQQVQAMYDFAKLGCRLNETRVIDLSRIIQEVVSDTYSGGTLDLEIGALPMVWASEALMRRVFINLLGNAIKYNDKQRPRVRISCAGIDTMPLGRFARILVEDNGMGIDPAERDRIFDMFRRGSGNESRSKEGLGVGLAVVKRIIELHYGSISVESEPGKGSAFVLCLPVEKVEIA